MFDIFGTIKSLIKLETVRIDNNVFRLHYRVTVVLLIAFSIVVNSRQYFGDPIDCTSDAVTATVIDNYCWMHSYLTFPKENSLYKLYPDDDGKDIGPGFTRANPPYTFNRNQRYYQWVGFVLFIQAAFFFLPRYLWKYYWEGGRIKSLVTGLTTSSGEEDKEYNAKINVVLNFLKRNENQNRIYAFTFFFCEFLNLVNVIGQIIMTDVFLNYEFSSLGTKLLSITDEDPAGRNDLLNVVFPKVAKCDFKFAGHNRETQPFRSICVLPVNTFNEKIYVILWFWFIFLSVVSSLHLLYTMVLILVPRARSIQLKRNFRVINENPWDEPSPTQIDKKNEAEGQQMTDDEIIDTVTSKLPVGDWFLLYQLGKNMDPIIFGRLLKEYAQRLKTGRTNSSSKQILASNRNSAFDMGKRGSLIGVGIGSSAPLMN